MGRRRSHYQGELNVWPAFVDVLATLLLVIILLVLAITLTQFYTADRANEAERLGSRLSDRLIQQREQIDALGAARQALLAQLDVQLEELNILTEERDTAQTAAENLLAKLAQANGETLDFSGSLAEAITQMDDKLARLLRVLTAAEAARASLAQTNSNLSGENSALSQENRALTQENDILSSSLTDLGERINDSLLVEAEELQRQRSRFFGSLVEVLGERQDVSVVGDRFVFQSEVLFDSGSAVLGLGGQAQLARLAETILALATDFPEDLDWILRIDGHTDARPIGQRTTSRFANNWQLSSERARSVVEFLIVQGVPPQRLAAAVFGEFQPLVAGDDASAFARNRRIEVKLTTR